MVSGRRAGASWDFDSNEKPNEPSVEKLISWSRAEMDRFTRNRAGTSSEAPLTGVQLPS